MDYPFKQLFMRKILSAAIATFFFSIIYAWLNPDLFGVGSKYSIGEHSREAFRMINVYMLYAAPAIYIYGISTSLISELIARAVTKRQWLRLAISTIFHCAFGLILLYISLLASLLFLLSDTMLALKMKKPLDLKLVIVSPLLPLCLWFMSVAYINITG